MDIWPYLSLGLGKNDVLIQLDAHNSSNLNQPNCTGIGSSFSAKTLTIHILQSTNPNDTYSISN